MLRLQGAGPSGLIPSNALERTLTDELLARGVVHPVAGGADQIPVDPGVDMPVDMPVDPGVDMPVDMPVDIVVPAYGRPDLLATCLTALRAACPDLRVIVVDDGTPDDSVVEAGRSHGAQVVRHHRNRGPAAARNTGLREATSPIVAFLDSDCTVSPGWLEPLLAHFDDPRIGAVAPRIVGRPKARRLAARYQEAHSALDMGTRPQLVTPGGAVAFLPSAALLVRRAAVAEGGFDEDLRLGEDVDLVWRIVDGGRLVRYEPAVTVRHEVRPSASGWIRQVFEYGTSAAELDRRHPGRLAPARLSGWNVAVAALLLAPRPVFRLRAAGAAGVTALSAVQRARALRSSSVDPRLAAYILGRRFLADVDAGGHLLRREWWPLGWLALIGALRSGPGRVAAAAMIIPVVREWLDRRPDIDLPRYLGLRLVEDAAYGSGVIAGAVGGRRPAVLLPRIRLP